MSGVNSVVAVVCGVGGEVIVGVTGTRKAVFSMAAGLLVGAAGVIAVCFG